MCFVTSSEKKNSTKLKVKFNFNNSGIYNNTVIKQRKKADKRETLFLN